MCKFGCLWLDSLVVVILVDVAEAALAKSVFGGMGGKFIALELPNCLDSVCIGDGSLLSC